jgi:hypothetical protein
MPSAKEVWADIQQDARKIAYTSLGTGLLVLGVQALAWKNGEFRGPKLLDVRNGQGKAMSAAGVMVYSVLGSMAGIVLERAIAEPLLGLDGSS